MDESSVKSETGTGPTVTLILGDDNFTFTLPFLESRHHLPQESVEVASCLPEDQIPNEYRPNYLALRAQGVVVHFGINPAQLRNHFFNNQYNKIMFILPGICFAGFPEFLDKKTDPLFRLRLHIYMFGFLKSSRNALKADALIQILWPRQQDGPERPGGELPQWVPWNGMDLAKIGPFCEVFRSEANDEPLDIAAFQDWHPLIHGIQTDSCPAYLQDTMFYCWRLTPGPNSCEEQDFDQKTGEDREDQNLLFVPPELWSHPVEVIPHVNELFKFELKTNTKEFVVVSKPTLKFDPRFRADGAPAKNPFTKRAGGSVPASHNPRGRGGGRGGSSMGGMGGRGGGMPMALPPLMDPQQQQGIAAAAAMARSLASSGIMPPPPPPPPDMFKQATAATASELYGAQLSLGYHLPPQHHPGLLHPHQHPAHSHRLAQSLYMAPPYQVPLIGGGPMGQQQLGHPGLRAIRHHTRPDLLLQDELSLQYGADLVNTVAGLEGSLPLSARYDLLDTDLLGGGGGGGGSDPDYDVYRAMELGLPLVDQFGVPLYGSNDVELLSAQSGSGASLMPGGLEHQDVLLYERQGAQLGGGSTQPSAARDRLLEEEGLLAPYRNDSLMVPEMMDDQLLDPRVVMEPQRHPHGGGGGGGFRSVHSSSADRTDGGGSNTGASLYRSNREPLVEQQFDDGGGGGGYRGERAQGREKEGGGMLMHGEHPHVSVPREMYDEQEQLAASHPSASRMMPRLNGRGSSSSEGGFDHHETRGYTETRQHYEETHHHHHHPQQQHPVPREAYRGKETRKDSHSAHMMASRQEDPTFSRQPHVSRKSDFSHPHGNRSDGRDGRPIPPHRTRLISNREEENKLHLLPSSASPAREEEQQQQLQQEQEHLNVDPATESSRRMFSSRSPQTQQRNRRTADSRSGLGTHGSSHADWVRPLVSRSRSRCGSNSHYRRDGPSHRDHPHHYQQPIGGAVSRSLPRRGGGGHEHNSHHRKEDTSTRATRGSRYGGTSGSPMSYRKVAMGAGHRSRSREHYRYDSSRTSPPPIRRPGPR